MALNLEKSRTLCQTIKTIRQNHKNHRYHAQIFAEKLCTFHFTSDAPVRQQRPKVIQRSLYCLYVQSYTYNAGVISKNFNEGGSRCNDRVGVLTPIL